ncbi:DUF554 domain-containing protein [Clostridium polynesiense]|uniref:DUF554 domain-containing protein n=1 Tax=Clostridium polynesiense TaxID=1325933 RepID=UPI00058BAC83|nr:DUF554 domain-containing protein [Clostridium polynesiense]
MKGTLVNCFAILIGGFIGLLIKGGIPEKINKTVMQAVGLAVIIIGISGSLKGSNMLLTIVSLALGALVGEFIDIENALSKFSVSIENKFKKIGKGDFSQGFVSATLLFCVGAMAIVGSLDSGLKGNHEILYTKSVLDGISSIVFASSLGVGVLFSSLAVLMYQGTITLSASLIKNILTPSLINEISVVGSILILALGLNILGITKIKVANMLPAIFIPMLYFFLIIT